MGKGFTKRQHYVPRFYLRHFADVDGRLHVYRRDTGAFFETTPENVCAENSLYEVKADNPSEGEGPYFQTNHIEAMLSHFESNIAPLYEELMDCCESGELEGMGFVRGRLGACALAANLIVRHPKMLREDRRYAPELARDHLVGTKNARKGRQTLSIEGNERATAELIIMQTELFSSDDGSPVMQAFDRLAEKEMCVLRAPAGAQFISSSFPVIIWGINDDDSDFEAAYMPLSSGLAAVFDPEEGMPAYRVADIDEVAALNGQLLGWNNAWDTAFGSSRGSIEAAVREWMSYSPGM